jgi:hypothetical protein
MSISSGFSLPSLHDCPYLFSLDLASTVSTSRQITRGVTLCLSCPPLTSELNAPLCGDLCVLTYLCALQVTVHSIIEDRCLP